MRAARRALRPYQEDVSDKFRCALIDTGRAQIVLATGLGKTVIMAEVVADLLRDSLIEHKHVRSSLPILGIWWTNSNAHFGINCLNGFQRIA